MTASSILSAESGTSVIDRDIQTYRHLRVDKPSMSKRFRSGLKSAIKREALRRGWELVEYRRLWHDPANKFRRGAGNPTASTPAMGGR